MGEQPSLLWGCDDGAGEHCRKSKLQRESPDAAFDHGESETFVKLPGEDRQYLEVRSCLEDPLLPRGILHLTGTHLLLCFLHSQRISKIKQQL